MTLSEKISEAEKRTRQWSFGVNVEFPAEEEWGKEQWRQTIKWRAKKDYR